MFNQRHSNFNSNAYHKLKKICDSDVCIISFCNCTCAQTILNAANSLCITLHNAHIGSVVDETKIVSYIMIRKFLQHHLMLTSATDAVRAIQYKCSEHAGLGAINVHLLQYLCNSTPYRPYTLNIIYAKMVFWI